MLPVEWPWSQCRLMSRPVTEYGHMSMGVRHFNPLRHTMAVMEQAGFTSNLVNRAFSCKPCRSCESCVETVCVGKPSRLSMHVAVGDLPERLKVARGMSLPYLDVFSHSSLLLSSTRNSFSLVAHFE